MIGHNAEALHLNTGEDADRVLADQLAANRSEEVLFLSKLTSESLQAFMINNSEALRHIVANNLVRNFEHRMRDLSSEEPSSQELGQLVYDMMAMAAQEANQAVFELQEQRIADLKIRAERAEASVRESNERFGQLVYDVRLARAEINRELMEDEDARDIVREQLIGIEDRPLVVEYESEDDHEMVAQDPTPAEVIRSLGSIAVQRSRSALSRLKAIATGEIKKSA